MRVRLSATVALWLAVALVTAYDLALAFSRPDLFPDLDVYRAAVGTLPNGGGLYDVIGVNGGPFTYPPIAAVLLWPVRLVPIAVAGALLAVLNVVATAATARLCMRDAPTWMVPAVTAAALWTVPFRTTVFFGQVGALLMLLVAADLLSPSPPWPRGVLVGIAAGIKLTPLLFVLFLWASRRRRDACTATASFAAATAVGAVLLPAESQRYWLHDLWHFGRVGELNGMHNRSVWGVLGSFGAPRPATLAVALVLAGIGLWRAQHLEDAGQPVAAMAVVGMTSCLVAPIAWSHHLVWVVPAVAALAGARRAAPVGLGVLLLVANARISGTARLLTLVEAAVALCVVLAIREPLHQKVRAPQSVA